MPSPDDLYAQAPPPRPPSHRTAIPATFEKGTTDEEGTWLVFPRWFCGSCGQWLAEWQWLPPRVRLMIGYDWSSADAVWRHTREDRLDSPLELAGAARRAARLGPQKRATPPVHVECQRCRTVNRIDPAPRDRWET